MTEIKEKEVGYYGNFEKEKEGGVGLLLSVTAEYLLMLKASLRKELREEFINKIRDDVIKSYGRDLKTKLGSLSKEIIQLKKELENKVDKKEGKK